MIARSTTSLTATVLRSPSPPDLWESPISGVSRSTSFLLATGASPSTTGEPAALNSPFPGARTALSATPKTCTACSASWVSTGSVGRSVGCVTGSSLRNQHESVSVGACRCRVVSRRTGPASLDPASMGYGGSHGVGYRRSPGRSGSRGQSALPTVRPGAFAATTRPAAPGTMSLRMYCASSVGPPANRSAGNSTSGDIQLRTQPASSARPGRSSRPDTRMRPTMHSTVAVAAMGCLAGDHADGEQVHCAGDERLRRADAGEEFQCAEPGDEQARAHPEDVGAVGDHALGDPLERACGGAEVADGSHDRVPSSRPDGIRLAGKKPDVEVFS